MSELLVFADEIDGVPNPSQNHELVGHEEEWKQLTDAFSAGNLHHGILLSGPRGIGKATFAFRLAAKFLSESSESGGTNKNSVDRAASKIAAGAHPNVLYVSRPWDAKSKRFATQITVDSIRKISHFLSMSKSEPGWRVVIIDSTDDMNRFAANALLKVLEEPPQRTVFLITSHSPASVLPTIRSRCRTVKLRGLTGEQLSLALNNLEIEFAHGNVAFDIVNELAQGSVRKAISIIELDGLALKSKLDGITSDLDQLDWGATHKLVDEVLQRGSEEKFSLLLDFLEHFIEMKATGKENANQTRTINPGSQSIGSLALWAGLWEEINASTRVTEGYNLDRKQLLLNTFQSMSETERSLS